ncbi:MAG: hypothetical protein HYW70_00300 [Candidatus Nealsonbacteria bacterium]|nr:hypothetical protein [Candidatus Nealsonbacteria bacterium]
MNPEAIQQFRKLYRERFGEELNDNEALLKATKLLNLYRTIYGTVSFDQIKKAENTNEKSNQ